VLILDKKGHRQRKRRVRERNTLGSVLTGFWSSGWMKDIL